MDSPINARSKSRSQTSPSATTNKTATTPPSFGSRNKSRFEVGAGKALRSEEGDELLNKLGGRYSSTTTTGTGTNNNAFSSFSSSSFSGRKSTPLCETVPLERREKCNSPSSFDAFIFEAMDSHKGDIYNTCSASKPRAVKNGRRSGKVPAQPTLSPNYYFQSADHHLNSRKNQCSDFDHFLLDRLKASSAWKDNEEDMRNQFHKLDPFHTQTATAAADNYVRNNSNDKIKPSRPAVSDFSFKPNINEEETVAVEVNSPRGVARIASGGGRKFNPGGSSNDSPASHEQNETKDAEMGDFRSHSEGRGSSREAFVFGAPKPKCSVAEECQSSSYYGEFEVSGDLPDGLNSSRGYGSNNLFGSERPVFGVRIDSFISASKLTDNRPIPSIITSNPGGNFMCENRENDTVKPNPLVEPFGSSDSTCVTFPSFPQASEKDTINWVASDGVHKEGIGGNYSSLEPSMSEDSSFEKDKASHPVDSSSSTLHHRFEFGVNKGSNKGHNARRKREKKYVHNSNVYSMGYPAHHSKGKLSMNFSPCTKSATENAPFSDHNMPNLTESSEVWGHNQYNLYQFVGSEANIEESIATNANMQDSIDHQTIAENLDHGESPIGEKHQFKWSSMDEGDCGIPARSNKWKSSSFEEHTPAQSSENVWLQSTFEKVMTDKCKNVYNATAARDGGSNQRRSSGLSSSASGFARKSHRPRVEGHAKLKISDMKFESSPFSTGPFALPTDAVEGHISCPERDFYEQRIEKEKRTVGAFDKFLNSPPAGGSMPLLTKQQAESEQSASPMVLKSAVSEQLCESWRLRGNQAYTNGDFSKAEDYYTRGLGCVSSSEMSQSCMRASMLCYSNRAATRMAVGRMREALTDCMRAMDIDSNFFRVRIRAASCHLALGECKAALAFFKECLSSGIESETLDSKITTEASEGIGKAQQVEEKTDRAVMLLNARNSEDVSNALCLVNEALSISPHSEKLLELKAHALLSLCKYEEAIQACEQSMESVEQNHLCGDNCSDNQMEIRDALGRQCSCPVKLWFWQMTGKAHFYLGKLDQALDFLVKYEEANSAAPKSDAGRLESVASLIVTIRDLLRHKAAGNEAFQAGKYAEAEEHYTAALACNNESRPFTAVCFCNRAAASHALRHIADAIADCSRAIALDPEYPKAISRRAMLHEMVRNYGQAISDLHRLIALQESQQQQSKGSKLGRLGRSGSGTQDLREPHERLAKAEEDIKKGYPLDHYLILGVEPSSNAAEIKKAYRKAALRHHPDKAGQFLVRSDSGDDILLKELGEEVRRDAEKLFKLIGEAYAVLSEPGKRLRYDAEEELRKLRTTGIMRGTETVSEPYHYQCEKGSRRHREGWDSWKDYENQYQYWQSGPDASHPDLRTRRGSSNFKTSDGYRWNDYDWDDI
eukprot:Gb_07120 [translate_table: standard]